MKNIFFTMSYYCFFALFVLILPLSLWASQDNDKNQPSPQKTLLAQTYMKTAQDFAENMEADSAAFYYEKSAIEFEKAELWDEYIDCAIELFLLYTRDKKIQKSIAFAKTVDNIIDEKIGPSTFLAAKGYTYMALAFLDSQDNETAKQLIRSSLQILHDTDSTEDPLIVKNFDRLANIYSNMEIPDSVLFYSRNAVLSARKILGPEHPELAAYYSNLALGLSQQAEFDSAATYYQKALEIDSLYYGEQHPFVGSDYYGLGLAKSLSGESSLAIQLLNKSLDIFIHTVGEDHYRTAVVYNELANIFYTTGEFDHAADYFKRSLDIKKNVYGKVHSSIGVAHENLASALFSLGKVKESLEISKIAEEIFHETLQEDHPRFANSYINMGACYKSSENWPQALKYFDKALQILKKNNPRNPEILKSLWHLGDVYLAIGDSVNSFLSLQNACSKSTELFKDRHPCIVDSYFNLGKFHSKHGNTINALMHYQKAIIQACSNFSNLDWQTNPIRNDIIHHYQVLPVLIEKARMISTFDMLDDEQSSLVLAYSTYRLAADVLDDLRQSYLAEKSKLVIVDSYSYFFDDALDVLFRLQKYRPDFSVREAFALAEKKRATALWETLSKSQAERLAGIPDSLLALELKIREKIAHFEISLSKELENIVPDSAKLQLLETHIFDQRLKFQTLLKKIESSYPAYYENKYQSKIYDYKEIQTRLDFNTTLVEYTLSDDALFSLVVTPDTIHFAKIKLNEFLESIDQFRHTITNRTSRGKSSFLKYSHHLYQILVKPIEQHLQREKVVLIPDGKLFYIPFEALVTSYHPDSSWHDQPFWVNEKEISYHYSATLFSTLKDTLPSSGVNSFVGFAPVFMDQSSEQSNQNLLANPQVKDLMHSSRSVDSETNRFLPLPETRKELFAIEKLQNRQCKTAIFINKEANETNFKNLKKHDVVHIASHAFFNEKNPALSGIAFAKESNSDEDGILYSSEIYNLDLDCDLVVLSSCEGGVGPLVKGEGLMALGRGFMWSGAENIIFSLWKADDYMTRHLMEQFYTHLQKEQSFSKPLTLAKRAFLQNPELALPAFWSSFILVGY